MSICKYNLIKFIVDQGRAFDDVELGIKPDDRVVNDWFHLVSRIYNHRMPQKLLSGLSRIMNDRLHVLCNVELKQYNARETACANMREVRAAKTMKWMQKIEVYESKQEIAQKECHAARQEIQRQDEARYVINMMPKWHAEHVDVIDKRERERNEDMHAYVGELFIKQSTVDALEKVERKDFNVHVCAHTVQIK